MIGLAISLMIQATVLALRLMFLMLRAMITITVLLVAWIGGEIERRRAPA